MLKISNLPSLLVLLLIAACQGKDADTSPAAEVSQPETTEMTEMLEMVGYLTAQSGGFSVSCSRRQAATK